MVTIVSAEVCCVSVAVGYHIEIKNPKRLSACQLKRQDRCWCISKLGEIPKIKICNVSCQSLFLQLHLSLSQTAAPPLPLPGKAETALTYGIPTNTGLFCFTFLSNINGDKMFIKLNYWAAYLCCIEISDFSWAYLRLFNNTQAFVKHTIKTRP